MLKILFKSTVNSAPLHPISASNLLIIKFLLDVRCDPQLCGVPETIHFTGKVFGELGGVDHQQCLIVGVCSRGRPIEGSCDHGFVIDHGELVIEILCIVLVMGGFRSAEGE